MTPTEADKLREEMEARQARWNELITEIRGIYMTHAINVESKLSALLVEMYIPRNSPNEYARRFHSFILGSRGLTFDGKITALRGGLMWRDGDQPLYTNRDLKPPTDPAVSPLIGKLNSIRDQRNSIAHADFNTVTWDQDSEEPTFFLNMVTSGGTVTHKQVSVEIVKAWVTEAMEVASELDRIAWEYRLGRPVSFETPESSEKEEE